MKKIKAIIMGAAGRDFHNYNVYFKNNPLYKVVAFTAFQIPGIVGRKYKNISIYPEEQLEKIIKKEGIDEVFFSYSDISYSDLMKKASGVLSAGANFSFLGAEQTMIKSKKPVIAVTAVRTGCGKSIVSQKIVDYFLEQGIKVGVVRHPMPYGDLEKQMCQTFSSLGDLDKHKCTIEEREEYEPYVEKGITIYAGVDYEQILRLAEKKNDVILWDGGNNDSPFFKPDLWITIADARRPGHETAYYPGEVNFRSADMIVIGKIDKESRGNVKSILKNVEKLNPKAKVVQSNYPLFVDDVKLITGKRVLIVEDGPSMTHGELPYGAGYRAVKNYKVKNIVDPRPYAQGSLEETFAKYTDMDKILPAMGYSKKQIDELEKTINKAKCDSVVLATPARIEKFIKINKPFTCVRYGFKETGEDNVFEKALDGFLKKNL
ncbi:MAG: cyclic 2,3-diphosphoglycerate synthase [Candidatus Marinimicrobia bacterium]|nr:cyclic 2,3-diphosphoglycerate synthase [Candidatus Neomarinimicrobiota bacterium]